MSDTLPVIRNLLSPWEVTFAGVDKADILIVHGKAPPENMKTVIIPSDSADFVRWLKDEGLRVAIRPGKETFVNATPQTVLSIVPRIQYYYEGSVESVLSLSQPLSFTLNDDTFLLTVDIVEEYARIMSQMLNPRVSTLYRILTSFPVPYTAAPKLLRNGLMGWNSQQASLDLSDKLPLDALRFLLARTIEEAADVGLERKIWNEKRYACVVTHDVDTRAGLKRASVVKRLEEKYDLPSAWYVPTKHYKLNTEAVRQLANYGEIGAHDTMHDGKLARLPRQKLVERLHEAKRTLERVVDCPVRGFRAPLLQHNGEIVWALGEAGYTYDTSVPSWEPKHPSFMKPYGIGTANPIRVDSIIEIPVTLPQDHQMLQVLGMTPKQTVEAWIELKGVVRNIRGICTILMHPSYEMAHPKNLSTYEDLINNLTMDNEAWLTIPTEIANRCLNS